MRMEEEVFLELGRKIKDILRGVPLEMSSFTLSFTDSSGINPREYVQEVNKDVNSVKGFEIFYVQESVAFPGQYDVYVRRERAVTPNA